MDLSKRNRVKVTLNRDLKTLPGLGPVRFIEAVMLPGGTLLEYKTRDGQLRYISSAHGHPIEYLGEELAPEVADALVRTSVKLATQGVPAESLPPEPFEQVPPPDGPPPPLEPPVEGKRRKSA